MEVAARSLGHRGGVPVRVGDGGVPTHPIRSWIRSG